MLIEHKLSNGDHVCNFCGHPYTDKEALIKKGNHFFCSKECILTYDDQINRTIQGE